MNSSNTLFTKNFKKGSRVIYLGIPEQTATVKALANGNVHLKYPKEKGYLIVPIAHCSLM